jgi:hypothetical protein
VGPGSLALILVLNRVQTLTVLMLVAGSFSSLIFVFSYAALLFFFFFFFFDRFASLCTVQRIDDPCQPHSTTIASALT